MSKPDDFAEAHALLPHEDPDEIESAAFGATYLWSKKLPSHPQPRNCQYDAVGDPVNRASSATAPPRHLRRLSTPRTHS
jgi:hypothetical protein